MELDVITVCRELADRSVSEREEYYTQRGVPAAVRDEIESLLATDDSIARSIASLAKEALVDSAPPDDAVTSGTITTQQPITIGRYEVLRLLGRGGMGEVHLARDPLLDRNVAVKLLGRELDDEASHRRLVREARAAGRLRHPNIVTIFDAGQHDGRSYIAMEYVPGETLRNLIRRRASLPLQRKLELIEGACAGLAHAHQAGVVHLDIKPDNLMLDESGVLKVLDFGIARVLQGETLATRQLAGTLCYMSPEQLQGGALDRRSDVFSLGCASFELLTYASAYTGSAQLIVTRITSGPVPRLLDVCPELDPRLDAIVGRAMALDPADRYDNLDDLQTVLARLRAEIGSVTDATPAIRPAVDPSPATQRSTSAWRSPVIGSIGAAAALATGLGAFWMWGARAPTTTPAPAALATSAAAPESARPVDRAESNGTRGNDEVWRRLATGDRRGVLELLRSAPADRKLTADGRLPYEVIQAVRSSVLRTRATVAAGPGVVSSTSYRSAEERLKRADRLEADARPVEALDALWQAADLYAEASAPGRVLPSPPSSGPDVPSQPPSLVVSAPVAEPVSSPPKPDSPRMEPAAAPPPVETAGIERAARADADSPKRQPSDEDVILETLRRYQAAYESLDVSGIMQVFPSLGSTQVEQLRQTFIGMSSYSIEIRNPRVDVLTDTATVRALVVRRMVPRVGRPVANDVETEFRFRRTGSGWVITAVAASGG
jgi:eukaryotic-like serine/threonine-protein kinase